MSLSQNKHLSRWCILIVLFVMPDRHLEAQEVYNQPLYEFKEFPLRSVYHDTKLSPEKRVTDLIKHLDFDEVVQLTGGYEGFFFPGVARLGLRPVFMANASQGVNLRERYYSKDEISTSFPGALALAATWNKELAKAMGKSIGVECRIHGVDFLLGPGINMQRFSVSGRNYEYYGEDPLLTSEMAVNFINGIQSQKVLATAKHFIGNDQEFCRHIASSNIDERTLREIYLRPWEAVIRKADVKSIMAGNNLINGVPCSMDKTILNDVLRDEYGFTGMSMTDWQNTNYFPNLQYLFPESGMSLLMPDNRTFRKYLDSYLIQYPEKREEVRNQIEKKVYQNLLPLFQLGVYDRPVKDEHLQKEMPEHKKTALKIAEEAICLLKNANNFLPLAKTQKILLTGEPELYSGKGSGFVKGYGHVSFADGLKNVFGKNFVDAVNPTDEQLKNADVIIYRLNKEAGEGQDVPFEIGEDENISRLAALNPNIVVLISSANAMPMPWLDDAKAVLWTFFLGQERGNALAAILTGQVNPSGKLPFTIEKNFSDSPYPQFNYIGNKPYWFGNNNFYKNYWLYEDLKGANEQFKTYIKPHEIIPATYKEGIFTGYRWYDKMKKEVLFPFGHGLSYTTFEYKDLTLSTSEMSDEDSVIVNLIVKNTGRFKGAEIVQLYISDSESSVERPVQELKHFEKVFLKAGEEKMVQFVIEANDLAFWDIIGHNWKVEPGNFKIRIGASSRDIKSGLLLKYL